MNNWVHHNNLERSQISSLRRYLVARSAGRMHPEWAYLEIKDRMAIWYGCDQQKAVSDGKPCRQLKMSDHWCPWLGTDLFVKNDHLLNAFFEIKIQNDAIQEEQQWTLLLKEFYKNRSATMRKWRELGAQILDRSSKGGNSTSVSASAAKLLVSEKYQRRGNGVRTIKSSKSVKAG